MKIKKLFVDSGTPAIHWNQETYSGPTWDITMRDGVFVCTSATEVRLIPTCMAVAEAEAEEQGVPDKVKVRRGPKRGPLA